jgi:hypothetical protein
MHVSLPAEDYRQRAKHLTRTRAIFFRLDPPTEVDEVCFREVDAKGADGVVSGPCGRLREGLADRVLGFCGRKDPARAGGEENKAAEAARPFRQVGAVDAANTVVLLAEKRGALQEGVTSGPVPASRLTLFLGAAGGQQNR